MPLAEPWQALPMRGIGTLTLATAWELAPPSIRTRGTAGARPLAGSPKAHMPPFLRVPTKQGTIIGHTTSRDDPIQPPGGSPHRPHTVRRHCRRTRPAKRPAMLPITSTSTSTSTSTKPATPPTTRGMTRAHHPPRLSGGWTEARQQGLTSDPARTRPPATSLRTLRKTPGLTVMGS